MTKSEVQKRVLQNGKPLSQRRFKWDSESRTFSSGETNLVFDFDGIDCCTFRTGDRCVFKTATNCNFTTGSLCTFETGGNCDFIVGNECIFTTASHCSFNVGDRCTFDVWGGSIFVVGNECVIISRDFYKKTHRVIEPNRGQKIKLIKEEPGFVVL